MHPNNPTLTLCHHDLRIGWAHQVPCHLQHPWKPWVAQMVEQGLRKNDSFHTVPGTPFMVRFATNCLIDGNAAIWVANTAPLGNGKIPPNTRLYAADLATQSASAPLVWRHIQKQYLALMMNSPAESLFHAPGLMPGRFPWLCGFPEVRGGLLLKDEWNDLFVMVRLVGLCLLEHAQSAVRDTAARGIVRKPDPELFLELRDWS